MIRLLCAGLGGMGRHDWGCAIKSGCFEPVAGVDVDAAARQEFEQVTGSPSFDSFDDALASSEADAALIAAPDQFHAPFTIKALEAGLDVICEKPMAETLADARRMHETAQNHERMLMIHQQLRWHPMFYQARRLIQAGELGIVRSVDFSMSVFSDICFQGYRSKLPQLILQDLAIHHLDLIRYLTNEECTSIYVRTWPSLEEAAQVPAPTEACAILEMTGPVTACYASSVRRLLEPVGYECAARIAGSKGEILLGANEITLQTRTAHKAGEEARKITPEPPEIDTWQAFAKAIETRQPTLTDSAGNLKSLEVLFAAIESAETGQIVRLG